MMHGSLVLMSLTTLEFGLIGVSSPYSKNFNSNFKAVLGNTVWERMLPIPNSGNSQYDIGTHEKLINGLIIKQNKKTYKQNTHIHILFV